MEVPVPVEATIHLDQFPDQTEVLDLLRSHGFQLVDLGEGQLQIRGYFSELRAVKVRLEQLMELRSPPPSSGAISKYYRKDRRSRSKDKPPPSSSSAGPSHLHHPTPDHQASSRTRPEVVVVDGDVFRYVQKLRKRDVESIQDRYGVRMKVEENISSSTITVQGRRSKAAAGELQKLLDDLSRSLRTQQVPLRDVDPDLLEDIRRNRNILGSVLLSEMEDGLHLIGPSEESYQLKQRLLGRQMKPSERPGRSFNRNPRNRSRSVPPDSRKNPEGEDRSKRSSSRNQEDKPQDVSLRSGASRTRSQSEPRRPKEPERTNDIELERNKLTSKSGRSFIQGMLSWKFIKSKFKKDKNK